MNKAVVVGAIAVVAVFAGVLYFAGNSLDDSPSKDAPAKPAAIPVQPVNPAAPQPPVSKSTAAARPVARDPRLAALMVTPDNAQIDYFADREGRVIREIDNDPNSPSLGKPLREYTYAGDKVIRLVVYRYLGGQVQVVTADVVYKADGSIDRYEESTRYEQGEAAANAE